MNRKLEEANGIGVHGTSPPKVAPRALGLSPVLQKLENDLYGADEAVGSLVATVNELRLFVEDLAVTVAAGCCLDTGDVGRGRAIGIDLASLCEGIADCLGNARRTLRKRAGRRGKPAPKGQTMPTPEGMN